MRSSLQVCTPDQNPSFSLLTLYDCALDGKTAQLKFKRGDEIITIYIYNPTFYSSWAIYVTYLALSNN